MAEHRNEGLKISGFQAPEVTQLQNGRYRLEFRCTGFSKSEDWYYENKEAIFAEYGSLSNALMAVDGLNGSEAIDPSIYPNMRLFRNRLEYTPSGNFVVYFLYETLTTSFVQESADKVDYELNGLRRVTRSLIAKEGANYGKTVATDTISHSEHGYSAITLYLASAIEDTKDVDEGGYVRIIETWVEAGTLRVIEGYATADNIKTLTYTYLVNEGSQPSGYAKKTRTVENYDGLQTITVEYWNTSSGIDGGNYSYQETASFVMPGTVDAESKGIGTNIDAGYLVVTSPYRVSATATVDVSYSTISTVSGASLYKEPIVDTQIYGSSNFNRGFTKTSSYSNYVRLSSGLSKSQSEFPDGSIEYIQGARVYGGTTGYIDINGSNSDPAGSTITVSRKAAPAYKDINGTQYYRHTTVTYLIPSR